MPVALTVLGSAFTPPSRQEWGAGKAFQVWLSLLSPLPQPPARVSLITAVEADAQRKGPAPKSWVYRAGTERPAVLPDMLIGQMGFGL